MPRCNRRSWDGRDRSRDVSGVAHAGNGNTGRVRHPRIWPDGGYSERGMCRCPKGVRPVCRHGPDGLLEIMSQKFVAAGPVSRILSAGLLRQDGHSSGPRITARLKRPTRRLWRAEPARAPGEAYSARPRLPPYLVLLRVGFALPAALLRRRCALTAPFHPYPGISAKAVYFLWHFPSNGPAQAKLGRGTLPDVIRHTALWSSDFPPPTLDAARATVRSSCQQCHCNSPGNRRWSSVVGQASWRRRLGQ